MNEKFNNKLYLIEPLEETNDIRFFKKFSISFGFRKENLKIKKKLLDYINNCDFCVEDKGFFEDKGYFMILLSPNINKGNSTNKLKNLYLKNHYLTVGLGNSEFDLAMLENVDIPIAIRNHDGIVDCFNNKDYIKSINKAPEGFYKELNKIHEKLCN
jgi:hydroxymethylpyrimidine pyrophosphatase-like HAD family hydrolase